MIRNKFNLIEKNTDLKYLFEFIKFVLHFFIFRKFILRTINVTTGSSDEVKNKQRYTSLLK